MYIVRWSFHGGMIHELVLPDQDDYLLLALESFSNCDWFKVCDSTGPIEPKSGFNKWCKSFPWETNANG